MIPEDSVFWSISAEAEVAKKEEELQEQTKTLLLTLQQIHEHTQANHNIYQLYRFGVELILWTTVVVQAWVEQHKKTKKGKQQQSRKAILEPLISSIHELTTKISQQQQDPAQENSAADSKDLFEVEDMPKELKTGLESAVKDIAASRKQSLASATALIASRAKIFATLHL